MYNPSTNKKFKSPVGRLAQVQAIQTYSRTRNIKPEDYYSSDVRRNPKFVKKDEYTTGIKEFPAIHKSVPHLLQGKPKKTFKDKNLFEMTPDDNKKCTCSKKSKSRSGGSPLGKNPKKINLDYRSEFHSSF